MKIFVSQLKISCECYHCQENIEEDDCVYVINTIIVFMSSLFTKVQSVESRPRCGGCSHILVKAVEDVAVSSYFGMVAGKNWGKIGPTLEWRPPWRRMRQESANRGGFFFLWNIRNFQPSVTVCVCANLGRTHTALCKAGQHFDISVIHCEVENHFKHPLAHCFLWVNYCFFWLRT